jgi:hypothetical protein
MEGAAVAEQVNCGPVELMGKQVAKLKAFSFTQHGPTEEIV